MRAQVEHGVLSDRRRVEAVCRADHRADELANGRERVGLGAEVVEHPQRLPAQLERLLDDPLGVAHRPAAQPSLEVVHVRARQAGERRAEEPVQVGAPALAPLEAQEREERLAERRLADPDAALDRIRHLELRQRCLELCPLALDARADDEDLFRPRPASDQLQRLVGDELERAARTGAFEEPDRALERRRRRGIVGEEVALEVRELGRGDLAVARPELLDAPVRERAEVPGRARERLERRPVRLVRERDGHLGTAGERFQERPLRSGQVLEPVGEDGAPRPRVELPGHSIGGVAPQEVAVPEAELVELRAIGGVEQCEVAAEIGGLDEARLELGQRGPERVREAREPRRRAEAVEGRGRNSRADEQLPLGIGRDRIARAACARDPLEDVVERPDVAREQRSALREELALDALDVRPVRHDEHRITVERAQIALQEQSHLARVRGP